ncbi:MAG: DUF4097 family beta strand repeat-containing protein [Blastocatellia bacterium]
MTIRQVMTIGWLILALAGFAQAQDKEFHQIYDLAANGSVGVYSHSGSVRVTGWDGNRVKVDAVKRGREADFGKIQIEVSARPERVEIRVVTPNGLNWRGGVAVDFEISVPRSAAVNPANTTSGDIVVTGPVERLTARATSGNITATQVSGELRANATSGTLTINDAGSRVYAQTNSGSIRVVGARDDVSATVSSGDIKLEKIGGRIVARSSSGWIVINEISGDVQATSFTDDVTVSNVRGRAVVSAISGNVVLRNISEGVKATAVSGSVSVSDSKGRIEVGATSDSITLTNVDSEEIVAKTTSGDVQFTGRFHDNGRYEFESFSGNVGLIVPQDSNFTLSAKTHNGSLNTEFPLQLSRSISGGVMTGSVGKGGADVRASSFSGNVRIRKNAR